MVTVKDTRTSTTVYTVAEELDYWQDASTDPSLLVGTWQGWDADAGYPSEVVSSITSDVLKFKGIGRGWMQDAWEEVIVILNIDTAFCGISQPYIMITVRNWSNRLKQRGIIQ